MKAFCIWCETETGNSLPKNGYFWIHQNCAHKLMDINDNIEGIRKILEGYHSRNKISPNKDRLEMVEEYINEMEDFQKKWLNMMKVMYPTYGLGNTEVFKENHNSTRETKPIRLMPK